MAESTAIKAKRTLLYILSSLYKLPCIPYKTFFKIFDSKVSAVMLYGAELWGFREVRSIEIVHTLACKKFLNIRDNACNDAILGDLGRYPMYINTSKKCLKFWIRILNMSENRFVKKCYNMLLYYDQLGYSNWVTEVRSNLYRNGFGYILERQSVSHPKLFVLQFVNRLKDQFIQKWRSNCLNSSKLIYYNQFKPCFGLEPYILTIDINKFRRCLASFRSSSHTLSVEKGRYYGISREFRFCPYCQCILEDELHFVLICPLYSDIRKLYIDPAYTNNPSEHSFFTLMSSRSSFTIKNLAMFLYYSFEKRNDYIKNQ